VGGLQAYVTRHLTPKVKLLQKTVIDGGDPKDLDLDRVFKSRGTCAAHFLSLRFLNPNTFSHLLPSEVQQYLDLLWHLFPIWSL
jgi:hypothetical protein